MCGSKRSKISKQDVLPIAETFKAMSNSIPKPQCRSTDLIPPPTHTLQIFEAMGDYIPEPQFYEWALPCMKRIADELRARYGLLVWEG